MASQSLWNAASLSLQTNVFLYNQASLEYESGPEEGQRIAYVST